MKFILKIGISLILISCLLSCSKRNISADAYGSFEADDVTVSAQSEGIILDFVINEGQSLKVGQYIATVDTMTLIVQKKKIELQLNSFLTQQTTLPDKFKLLNDSLLNLNRSISDIGVLYKENILLQKRLDSLLNQRNEIEKAIYAQEKSFSTQVKLLAMQAEQLYLQLRQLNDALSKCIITSPIHGTAITKYVDRYEIVGMGSPVVRIADLSQMDLKVYVTEDQLSFLRLGDSCSVYIDDKDDELKEYRGNIVWISSESEFTPKMIQTKKERVNLVYAVKIKVKNDGSIKIGMPGEVVFTNFK
jgi:HlyD family secretion protein